MSLHNRITLALPPIVLSLIIFALTACGGTAVVAPPPPPPGTKLSVSPASITVDAGSATAFTAIFTPAAPTGGSLTWSIIAVDGGTINGEGVYTASSNAGKYSILATWTPSLTSKAAILKGTSTVKLLPVPQLDSVISPSEVQATGANQSAGANQNGAVVGQGIPSVASTDSGGNTQVVSGFTIPASTCGSGSVCK